MPKLWDGTGPGDGKGFKAAGRAVGRFTLW